MAKIKDILSNISNVKVGTWVRGILLIISLVNMALSAAGKAPIPADYNEIYTIVSIVFSVVIGMSVKYPLVYGSLASVMIILFWLYVCGNIVIMGNIINVAIENCT